MRIVYKLQGFCLRSKPRQFKEIIAKRNEEKGNTFLHLINFDGYF